MKSLRASAAFLLTLSLAGCTAASTRQERVIHSEKVQAVVSELLKTERSTARFEAGLRALGAKIIAGDRIGKMVAVIPPPPSKDLIVVSVFVNYAYLPDDRFAYESMTTLEFHREP